MTVVGESKQASKVACLQAVDVLQRRNPLELESPFWGKLPRARRSCLFAPPWCHISQKAHGILRAIASVSRPALRFCSRHCRLSALCALCTAVHR